MVDYFDSTKNVRYKRGKIGYINAKTSIIIGKAKCYLKVINRCDNGCLCQIELKLL